MDESAISNISSIRGANNPVSPYGEVYPSQPPVENYNSENDNNEQNDIDV